jgi:iron uptake system component EfeO
MKSARVLIAMLLALPACSSDDSGDIPSASDASYEHEVVIGMHAALLTDVQALHAGALELQAAAPTPTGRGWDAGEDALAISAMTQAWLNARSAYERSEGALAPLFPMIDEAIDFRYDDFIADINGGDQDLFDAEGVTGMHAIERILFARETPAAVIEVEASLPGYKPAAWPATEAEAQAFKTKLCAQLVKDAQTLTDQWQEQTSFDLPGAFNGLIALMNEQREKVNKAASQEEESRYAQRTLADLRDNLAGTTRIYTLFQAWLHTKSDGAAIDADIESSFASLDSTYKSFAGDAIPAPSATWSSEKPSAADLQTPFGRLYTAVQKAVDPNVSGSAVDGMNRAARELGFPELVDE